MNTTCPYIHHTGKPSEASDHPLLDFFQHGHVEAPDHNLHPPKDPHVYGKGEAVRCVLCGGCAADGEGGREGVDLGIVSG